MTYTNQPVTQEDLSAFLAAAQNKINTYYAGSVLIPVLAIDPGGKKYARVVLRNHPDDQYGSAWAFIELATGFILKPAGWKTPAKHARGSVHTLTHGVEFVGPYGPAYLR